MLQLLKQMNQEWAKLWQSIEREVFRDRYTVAAKARTLAEKLINDVVEREFGGKKNLTTAHEKTKFLEAQGIMIDSVLNALGRIRRTGNEVVHENNKLNIAKALKIHQDLYDVLAWYFGIYGDPTVAIPEYEEPTIETVDEQILQKIAAVEQKISAMTQPVVQEAKAIVPEVQLAESGSHLHAQLLKLSEASLEAIESDKELSQFKRYMHIERPIQRLLEEKVVAASQSSTAQLVLLCGSVGDGKSHLLAHLKTEFADTVASFKFHNDATESFDPQKNSLDTLADVLRPFSDERLASSSEKMILAINLGVLRNFLDSDYVQNDYQQLKAYIDEANVFDAAMISQMADSAHFKLVNFGDYHPFELTDQGPLSTYIAQLLTKIVEPVADNAFYNAYLHDRAAGGTNPLLLNYEMLQSPAVREQLVQLLVKMIIKQKTFLSTRALLNFIHDILVPSDLTSLQSDDVVQFVPHLLPSLLFNGAERSNVLRALADLDPLHIRLQGIDDALIRFHNAAQFGELMRDYIQDEAAQPWLTVCDQIESLLLMERNKKTELAELFIRTAFLFNSTLRPQFTDDVYRQYMTYLYRYNSGNTGAIYSLFEEVKHAIFAWKGTRNVNVPNFVYVDEETETMRIGEVLELQPVFAQRPMRMEATFDRFVTTMSLQFTNAMQQAQETIEIDYPLYATIHRLSKGYRLNKSDQNLAIQFVEFIDRLLPLGRQKQELFIHDVEDDKLFCLQYNAFNQQFEFTRR